MLTESPAFSLGLIGIAGFACQWLAWRLHLPAILFLLVAGMVMGPWWGWIDPDDLMGEMLFPMVSLAVALILFEGSLTLRFSELQGLQVMVRRLVSLGMWVNWLVIAVLAKYLIQLDWSQALLFGSLVVVTGPTVIVPMLRSVRPHARIGKILRWEGIVIDPIGALMAVLVYEFIFSSADGLAFGQTMMTFTRIILIGGAFGIYAGYFLGLVLRKGWLPDYLDGLATVTVVLFAFASANSLEHESGLLTVTIMGIWLANMPGVRVHEILAFKENLSVLLISGLFVLLAARIDPQALILLGWPAVGLLLGIHFIARPLAVWLCAIGTDLTNKEKLLVSWIGPRGIVAAAVSGLFALRMEQASIVGGEFLVPLTFMVIIGTVLLQGATAGPLARFLGLADPEPNGFLIAGANPVARAFAKPLKEMGLRVMLADRSWDNIKAARMEGFETFHGSLLSEYANERLDLAGLGHLITLLPQREVNALSAVQYRNEFGHGHIFSLHSGNQDYVGNKYGISDFHHGNLLGDNSLTYNKVSSLLKQGARIRTTLITDTYDYKTFLEEAGTRCVPLLAFNKKNKVFALGPETEAKPEAGWTIISLDYRELTGGLGALSAVR